MKNIIKIFIFLFTILLNTECFALEFASYIPPSPKEALIVIHGYGQNGKKMQWITNNFQKDFPTMAFFFPTAPNRAPQGGYQWFEIQTLGESMNEAEIYNKMMSTALPNLDDLHSLIEYINKTHNIPFKNIHISGFSQGGFMAILTSLTYSQKIGKVISFSGVPLMFTKDFTIDKIKSSPNILLIQGTKDNVIPQNSHIITKESLEQIKIFPDIAIIPNMPHTINVKAQQRAKEFLKH